MKYCPYCGADLPDSNALFYSECGAKMPPHETGKTEPLRADMRPASQEPKPETYKGKKKKEKKKKPAPKQPSSQPAEVIPTEDDGYDGYYDDVQPPDLDRSLEGIDKELVKKVVVLGVCVLLIISLCVVLLYAL